MNVAKLVKSSLYNKHKYNNARDFQPSFSITMREKQISRVFVLLLNRLPSSDLRTYNRIY